MPTLRRLSKSALVSTAFALVLALVAVPSLLAGEAHGKKKSKDKDKFKPKAIHKVMAEYPEEAREARTEGQVVAGFSINADGTVSDVKIKEGDKVFHKATVAALEQWKFEPVEIPTYFVVTLNFRLDGEKDGAKKEG